MPKNRSVPYAIILGSLIILAALFLFRSGPQTEAFDPDSGRVRVVNGTSIEDNPATVLPPSRTVAIIPPPADRVKEIEAAMIQAFPMIREVQVECDPDCTLIAALGPNATTGDWPRSRWPYDGNLENFLAARGYVPLGPLQVDQPGDNDTLLRVPVRLVSGPGS